MIGLYKTPLKADIPGASKKIYMIRNALRRAKAKKKSAITR
jgi:hypothetical protein